MILLRWLFELFGKLGRRWPAQRPVPLTPEQELRVAWDYYHEHFLGSKPTQAKMVGNLKRMLTLKLRKKLEAVDAKSPSGLVESVVDLRYAYLHGSKPTRAKKVGNLKRQDADAKPPSGLVESFDDLWRRVTTL